MIKGKTQSGFAYKLDESKLDDMEILEFLAEIDDDMTKLPKLLELFLGKEQKQELYDFVKKSDGHVSITSTQKILMEIFADAGNKNEEIKKD